MTPAGTSNELDVHNEREENTHTITVRAGFSPVLLYCWPNVTIIPSSSGNLFKCHEEVLYLQPMIPPTKRFDIFPGGCSEDAFRFFFKQ